MQRGAVTQGEVRRLRPLRQPQLHTHLVIANRVQAVRDGKWQTLDSCRPASAALAGCWRGRSPVSRRSIMDAFKL
ncbi:hypothetical protein E2R32_05695 [Rathayibacter toxicus]|nr:relaxase domain-containing protein [Rathayibacter toxicus]QOD09526.1 relaxase domain-containing protein [Rathayibacter toxicus]QWL26101.1 hypothetical protein E2R32_05695 [Rathayibacter toxicus]QWL28195.1 hypothetical protein E2R33_05935 [Rathayibacter toxicus]QWL30274.1 hypothetical protein E2R34_05615 [Rathayibacter toxicus]